MRIAGRTPHDILSGCGDCGEQASLRISQKQGRYRRGRHKKCLSRASLPSIAVFCFILGLAVTVFAFYFLSTDKEIDGRFGGQKLQEEEETNHEMHSDYRHLVNNTDSSGELRFGRGSATDGRDSRYWDRNNRWRDGDYDEDDMDVPASFDGDEHLKSQETTVGKFPEVQEVKGLYNEAGRNELKKFEDQYMVSLDAAAEKSSKQGNGVEVNSNNDYDDRINMEDDVFKTSGEQGQNDHFVPDGRIRKSLQQKELGNGKIFAADPFRKVNSVVSLKASTDNKYRQGGNGVGLLVKSSSMTNKPSSKGKRHHSCEMKLLDVSQFLEPSVNRNFSRFSLNYTETEDRPDGIVDWEPRFAGHQSLWEREKSFYAHDKKINCGFIKGSEGSQSTGFDLADDDVKFMSTCQVAVSSCIFGNSDHLRKPYVKKITHSARNNVCFVMFMDENTLQTLSLEGQKPDSMGFIGMWKIVTVRNLPYGDMRRVGKIPKFLSHRLFPSARYSIWLDSKLRLQSNPLQILEYFLWRKSHEYAISNHYDRHCVWEEVLQNKKLNKFNHTIIDQQFEFYQDDGLKRFDPTDQNRLLPSNVPEGSFIIRAHTPMSNLFSCLWFNEVDRFTPRDQLSFAYTYLKLRRTNPAKPFYLNMFKDCERRSIAKLFRHRGEEDKRYNPLVQSFGGKKEI